MDFEISNYTIEELHSLIGLEDNDNPTTEEILEAANTKINEYESKNEMEIKDFFVNIRKYLLDKAYISSDQDSLLINNETDVKAGKFVSVSSKKGELNPNYKNHIKRILNIDTSYRQNSFPVKNDELRYGDIMTMETSAYSNTHFSCNLTDKLTNLTSMQLYSYQIPYSWYSINRHNNMFKINEQTVTIEPANYTNEELIEEISNNQVFIDNSGSIFYDSRSSKTTIKIEGDASLVFYDYSNTFRESKSNYNLGWMLGYRNSMYTTDNGINSGGMYTYKSDAIVNIIGPKYLMLIVDEFSLSVDNVGVVSIETSENKATIPSYFSNDLNFVATEDQGREIAQYSIVQTVNNVTTRKITKAQQTTINEIIKSRNDTTADKVVMPRNNNTLAIIPIRKGNFGEPIDIFSGIKEIKRIYFGPLTIDRLEIKLIDDKGFIVDLNGLDWSFSLITEHLYKY
tara:strand:+ start:1528 stop:2895 length:1368 start_codon:yes stop_codon:yes gene_type:complete